MYIRQEQISISTQLNPPITQQTKYRTHLIMSIVIGILVAGIVLSVILTLYLDNHSTTTGPATTITKAQIQYNQTNSSNPPERPYYCSGISPCTLWTLYVDAGITMNIDTSNCSFNSTPLYFTSIAGQGSHWELVGYGAIYSAAPSSFTIYARSFSGINNTLILNYSIQYKWNVNWFGILE